MFNLKRKIGIASLLMAGMVEPLAAHAQEDVQSKEKTTVELEEQFADSLVPVVNPNSECPATRLGTPEGMVPYTFLNTKSCHSILVMPPTKVQQGITARPHPNLNLCKSFKAASDNIDAIDSHIKNTDAQIEKLSLTETDDPVLFEKIEKMISTLEKRRQRFIDQKKQANVDLKDYDDVVGAEFHVTLDSSVKSADLNTLANSTSIPIANEGRFPTLPDVLYIRPRFTPATIQNSIFSFDYYSPKNDENASSIYKSNIPGLQILQQEGSDFGTAHVKAKNGLSGFVSMRLSGVCGYEVKNDNGSFDLIEDGNPIFVVNQTYEVQQQFEYGYVASLEVDNVITKIVDESIYSENEGFTKTQIFENTINGDLDSVLKFHWTANHNSEEHNYDSEMVQEVKTAAFADIVDNLFDRLVDAEILEIVPPSEVDNAQGGHLDVSKVGTRCWIERKWWGRRRKKCANYTYKVKEWRDGITEKELTTTLNINFKNSEEVKVKAMTPFYFTTTFEPSVKK